MKYSEEFKQKVLSLKKIDKEYAEHILNFERSGNLVGSLLKNYSVQGVSARDVISACENNDLQDIYEQAKDKLAAEKLFEEWWRDYYPQYCIEEFGVNPFEKNSHSK